MSRRDPRLLTLDLGGSLAPPLPARHGVVRNELSRDARRLSPVLDRLLSAKAPSGFAKLPGRRAALDATLRTAKSFRRRKFRDWVHVGIGGSSLGAEAILQALGHPLHNLTAGRRDGGPPRVHFVDNVDPERLGALLDFLDLRRTGLHVVSKSGGTAETAAVFDALRHAFAHQSGASWSEQTVLTTGRGALAQLAKAEHVARLPFPEDVGGRFSALSPSGLLTPAIAGVRAQDVVAGARRYLSEMRRAKPAERAPALAAAAAHRLAEAKGKPIHVLMPYGDRLEALARWYVQLFAESLGKRLPGRHVGVGPTPVPARGSTDQHAQVQLFIEGPRDKWVTFVHWGRRGRDRTLAGFPPTEFLAGVPMGELLDASRRGTEIALARAKRPTATWNLHGNSESFGAFLLALELQVAFQAELYGIDAYDQPGVEAGKVAAYALIGREGYEAERERIDGAAAPRWLV